MEEALLEKDLNRVLEMVEHKYYGKYRGIVADNDDPEKLGRIKVKVPGVLGNDVVTGWAMPCSPYGGAAGQGWFAIPEIDAGVWVEFEAGDLEFPIWVGTYWRKPGGTTEIPAPADSQSPPTVKLFKTQKGHTIELEDADGEEKVEITEAANNHVITMDSDGIKILHSSGAMMEFGSGGDITIQTTGTVTVEGTEIKLGANALKGVLFFEDFQQLWINFTAIFMSHMHTGNLGAPAPLIPAAPLPTVTPANAATKVKVE